MRDSPVSVSAAQTKCCVCFVPLKIFLNFAMSLHFQNPCARICVKHENSSHRLQQTRQLAGLLHSSPCTRTLCHPITNMNPAPLVGTKAFRNRGYNFVKILYVFFRCE